MRYTVRMSFDVSQFLEFDALVAAGVAVGSMVFTYTFGRYSVVPMVAALGTAAAFAALAPYIGHIPGAASWPEFQQRILVFSVATILAYVVYRRHTYFEPIAVPEGFELIVCGLLIAGFILAVVGAFLPADVLATISPQLRMVFSAEVSRTLWLAAPIVVFGVMRGR
jgi:predicted PurR-regulated permease PerM